MKILSYALVTMLAVPMVVDSAHADGMFDQGDTYISVLLGTGSAFNSNYLIVGGGITYFVYDGLGVGVSYESWSGNGPGINRTTPSLEYVIDEGEKLKPYLGLFYRNTAIAGMSNQDAVGGRAGLYMEIGEGVVLGAGMAYESYQNCQTTVFSSCSESYPELSLRFVL